MSLLAVDVEEAHGACLELWILDAELRQALLNESRHLAHLAYSREVSLHVGHKAGHASLAKTLGHHLQRDGLTRTGSAGDKSVTIGHLTYYR